ncbi:MAG: 5-oxoprolinase subunit PxpB [Flavobacteriaceae bacterium]|nr:5-oxoprolinase subunit PxpB [Flavobacteriaceae bacterium]
MNEFPVIKPFGEQAVLLEWNNEISFSTHKEVMGYKKFIDSNYQSILIETVPTYCSLAIYFKDKSVKEEFISVLKSGILFSETIQKKQNIIQIPVCYDLEFGLDLAEMAEKLKIAIDEIISRHTTPEYSVYFLGFLPGFPYLGGLDTKIAFPRKATPRQKISKGSVGIAGFQTGIYTVDSPGGWNIIGRSPLQFFDVTQSTPCLMSSGDVVRFYAISRKRFDEISKEVANKTYKVRMEVRDV